MHPARGAGSCGSVARAPPRRQHRSHRRPRHVRSVTSASATPCQWCVHIFNPGAPTLRARTSAGTAAVPTIHTSSPRRAHTARTSTGWACTAAVPTIHTLPHRHAHSARTSTRWAWPVVYSSSASSGALHKVWARPGMDAGEDIWQRTRCCGCGGLSKRDKRGGESDRAGARPGKRSGYVEGKGTGVGVKEGQRWGKGREKEAACET
eukprot:21117-Chlamydomonas_euryale.AAC.1